MLLNCGVREDSWESLGQQGDQTRRVKSILKEISPQYSLKGLMLKLQSLAIWCEELTHWKRIWCWERLMAGGEGGNREWDGWMASPIQWTWVWANTRRWWRTGKPAMLQSMWSQRVEDGWVTEQQQHALWKLPIAPCHGIHQGTYAANESTSPLHFESATELSLNIFIMPVHMNSRGKHRREGEKEKIKRTKRSNTSLR